VTARVIADGLIEESFRDAPIVGGKSLRRTK
jgi:hypothetical protein